MPVPPASSRLHPAVEVRPSSVAGRGLFAAQALPAGTVVVRVGGRLVDTEQLHRLFAEHAAGRAPYVDTVVVAADRHLVIESGDHRFGNHGCDPNLGWVDAYRLATMVDVPPDRELLTDYAMSTADPSFVLRCHCESYRCRQMVAGDDWRIPQLQQRYDGWWVPYVQGLVDAAQQVTDAGRRPGVSSPE